MPFLYHRKALQIAQLMPQGSFFNEDSFRIVYSADKEQGQYVILTPE
jgi:hypothetical protein